ncbi:MAG: hypothetical protein ACWGQW_00410 [bacterium]
MENKKGEHTIYMEDKKVDAIWFEPDQDAKIREAKDEDGTELVVLNEDMELMEFPVYLLKGHKYYLVPKEFMDDNS